MAAYAWVPLTVAAAASILLLILVVQNIDVRNGTWLLSLPGAVLPWMLLLGAVTIAGLVLGVKRRRAPAAPVATLGDRLVDALRNGEHDLARTQRVAVEVVNALPDPVYFKSAQGRTIGVDEAWQRLFGVSRTAFVCDLVQTLYRRLPDEDGVPQASIGVPRRQTYRTTITTGSGERIETLRHKAVIAPADISASGLIGTVVNIVERKEAELFDMLGYAKAELTGREFVDADQAALPRDPKRRISDRIADGGRGATVTLATEAPCVRADGSTGWEQRTVAVVSNASGRPHYLYCTVEDITSRRLGEQRLAMERAVNRVLSDAKTVSEALPAIIEGICRSMAWRCGRCWILDREAGGLRFRESWGMDTPELAALADRDAERVVMPAPASVQDPVQRTFMAGRPVWIANGAADAAFSGAAALARAGLQGVFGLPLLVGNDVLGVMEFFHRDAPEPDEALLTTVRSIGNQVGQFVARLEVEDTARITAAYDPLTRLPNRQIFRQRLEHAFVQAKRRGTRLAVMFIDLDHFKIVNDTLGHDAGDQLLLEVSSRLRDNLRASDTVARLGGDEFVVLVEDVSDPMYVGNLARKLIDALSESYLISGNECRVTASIGSSTYPDDGEDVSTLLKNADIAMYRAKEQGRNGFQFFSERMNTDAVERMTVEADLRRAIERDELVLHYQPKIDVRSGRVTGLEALVRWQHPEMGLVPPAHFMRVANEAGLIVPISEWVLKTACAVACDLALQGMSGIPVAVNLSPRQFMHGDLLKDVERVLVATGCSAGGIALEITESMVMHDPERATALIRSLKTLGVQIVIDDFGTGYSSLNYLQHFPVDALKIDRSFMKATDAGTMAIARTIIAMAHNLNFRTIAEGVETRQQFDFLREQGCDEVQGYYVSKPLAITDAIAFIDGKIGNCSMA